MVCVCVCVCVSLCVCVFVCVCVCVQLEAMDASNLNQAANVSVPVLARAQARRAPRGRRIAPYCTLLHLIAPCYCAQARRPPRQPPWPDPARPAERRTGAADGGGGGVEDTRAHARTRKRKTHTHIRTHARTHARARTHTHVHTNACTNARTNARTRARARAPVNMFLCFGPPVGARSGNKLQ